MIIINEVQFILLTFLSGTLIGVLAGMYLRYLTYEKGKDGATIAIEVDKFDDMARTMLVIYNHHEILGKLNTIKENHSPDNSEGSSPSIAQAHSRVELSDSIHDYNPDYAEYHRNDGEEVK